MFSRDYSSVTLVETLAFESEVGLKRLKQLQLEVADSDAILNKCFMLQAELLSFHD